LSYNLNKYNEVSLNRPLSDMAKSGLDSKVVFIT